jgi:hypothetical protein
MYGSALDAISNLIIYAQYGSASYKLDQFSYKESSNGYDEAGCPF